MRAGGCAALAKEAGRRGPPQPGVQGALCQDGLSLLNPGENKDQFGLLAAAGVDPSESPERPAAGRRDAAPGKAAFMGWAWEEHWAQVTDGLSGTLLPLCHLGVRWVLLPGVAVRAKRSNPAKHLNSDEGATDTQQQPRGR